MLINDLEQITLMCGQFYLTEDALECYAQWCYTAKANPPFHDTKFEGYCGRRRNHLLSIAMVCSASRTNDLIIEVQDLERSIHLLAEAEIKMGTVFRGIGRSDLSSLISDVIAFLMRYEGSEISMWEFARRFESDMDKYTLDRVLGTVSAMNYAEVVRRPGLDPVIRIKKDPPLDH